MNSVHPPAHTHHREEQLLLETDAARPAGHLTLAAAEAVCAYSGHHLLQSNLNMTFALLSSFPPPEPQENRGISTAKHQLHCPNPAKIGAVLRVIPSGTPLTPDPKRDKMAPFPHPQLCTQDSSPSSLTPISLALTKILVAFGFAFPFSHGRWQMSVSVK